MRRASTHRYKIIQDAGLAAASPWSAATPAGWSAAPGSAPRPPRSARLRRSCSRFCSVAVGLLVAILGGFERDLRAGELGLRCRRPSACPAAVERGADPRACSAAYCVCAVGIGRRERDRGKHRDVLHRPADALLVGAQPVGHGERLVDPRDRGRARRRRCRLRRCTSSPYWRRCRRPARSRCRTAGRRPAAAGWLASVLKKSLPAATAEAAASVGVGELAERRGQRGLQIGRGRGRACAPMVNSFGARRRRGRRGQREVSARCRPAG